MKIFNVFQMVAMFAAFPFGLSWLSEQHFGGAGAAWWVAAVAYLVSFGFMIFFVHVGIEEL